MSDTYAETRRHTRVPMQLPARLSTIEPERDPSSGRPFFRGSRETCINVSQGGVFVGTGEPLAPGRRVLVVLSLPDGKPLEAIGRVAWSRRMVTPGAQPGEGGIGIEFLGAAADRIRELESLISLREAETRAGD